MKDEIKQMIDNLKFISKQESATIEINQNGCKVILDYITNLQEENERLNNIINELEKWLNKNWNKPLAKIYVADIVKKISELKENK